MSRTVGGDLEVFVSGQEVADEAQALLSSLGYATRVSVSGDGAE